MEIAGVPTVLLGFVDQIEYVRLGALVRGCPNIRYVNVPRIGDPEVVLLDYYDEVIAGLTDPLTPEEASVPIIDTSPPERVLFKGSLLEAQEFFKEAEPVPNTQYAPICKWTDGLPIVIPTEQAVAEMMTGTSHDPDEMIKRNGGTGDPRIYGMRFTSTVEKVAICAVMAGCEPEYLPVALAIAERGGNATSCPGTSSMQMTWHFVSGPIAKEIGMNCGQGCHDVGNQANSSLGRVGDLISINFGECRYGAARSCGGNPTHSLCFAEDLQNLPPGWEGFNEDMGYNGNESVLGSGGGFSFLTGAWGYPGYYRSLPEGKMGYARMVGVDPELTWNWGYGNIEGQKGPYNWLDAIAPRVADILVKPSVAFFIIHPSLAQLLYDYGFESKAEVYQYLYDNYFFTVEDWFMTGYWAHSVQVRRSPEVESTVDPETGREWVELLKNNPETTFHVFGHGDPMRNCIVVASGYEDEHWYFSTSGSSPRATPIDPWR